MATVSITLLREAACGRGMTSTQQEQAQAPLVIMEMGC